MVKFVAATVGAVKFTLLGVKNVKSAAVPTPEIVVPVAGVDVYLIAPGANTPLGGASGTLEAFFNTLIIGAVSNGDIGFAISFPLAKLVVGIVSGHPADRHVNRFTVAIVLLNTGALLPKVIGAPKSQSVTAVKLPVQPPADAGGHATEGPNTPEAS
jgi:hypothetical protein